MPQKLRILLVGIYPPAVPALLEMVKRAIGQRATVEALVAEDAPDGLALWNESDQAIDLVAINCRARGFQPSAEGLVRSLKEDHRFTGQRLVIGETTEECKPFVLAGCEHWCSLKEFAAKAAEILAATVAA